MIKKILLLISLTIAQNLPAETKTGKDVAVITDVSGEVILKNETNRRTAAVLDVVSVDNEITIPEAGRITLVMLATGSEMSVEGPNAVIIGSSGINITETARSHIRKLLPDSIVKPINANGLRYASLRMRGEPAVAEVNELIPSGSIIADTTPKLEWLAVEPGITYSVSIYDDAGNVVVQKTTQDSYFEIPDDQSLLPGCSYVWEIKTLSRDGVAINGFGDFAVADVAKITEIEPYLAENNRNASKSQRVLNALILEREGFIYEASRHWKAIGIDRRRYAGSFNTSINLN